MDFVYTLVTLCAQVCTHMRAHLMACTHTHTHTRVHTCAVMGAQSSLTELRQSPGSLCSEQVDETRPHIQTGAGPAWSWEDTSPFSCPSLPWAPAAMVHCHGPDLPWLVADRLVLPTEGHPQQRAPPGPRLLLPHHGDSSLEGFPGLPADQGTPRHQGKAVQPTLPLGSCLPVTAPGAVAVNGNSLWTLPCLPWLPGAAAQNTCLPCPSLGSGWVVP